MRHVPEMSVALLVTLKFLVEQKIDSISLHPDTVLKTTLAVLESEK